MGYVRTGGMSTAARRRRQRTALVISALVLLLLGVFAYAGAYYQGWIPGSQDTAESTSSPTPTEEALQPGDVTVNVYNASGVPGLAGRTAEAVEARGFTVGSVANDPENATIEHAADIRHGPDGEEAAELLQAQVPGAELAPDDRESAEVDLVLGDAFEELPEVPADDSEATAEPEG
jgi:LytR cell envelope-related transcriptional attenuator